MQIWGLDFGDCHRSLFAHNGAVAAVAFVPGTHYVLSAGRDGLLKYWDADRFELLLELRGHHGQLWGLAVSTFGDFCVTSAPQLALLSCRMCQCAAAACVRWLAVGTPTNEMLLELRGHQRECPRLETSASFE